MESNKLNTILIVDDDPDILDLLNNVVKMEEYNTVSATDGKEAISVMKQVKVDAVISDIIMPNMSGLELLVSIKQNYTSVPVMLITGYGGRCTPETAKENGADAYLTKPFKTKDLTDNLSQILRTKPIQPE